METDVALYKNQLATLVLKMILNAKHDLLCRLNNSEFDALFKFW